MSSRKKVPEGLHGHLTSLKHTSPGAALGDISALKDNLEDKKIIGMGEATHSSKEFYQVKHRFFRFLVEELDYKIFAWEASFGETLFINNYVMNGEGKAEEVLGNISSPNCKMEEVLNLVEWVREYNKQVSEGDKIRFYGFDMQNDIASFKKLREMLENVDREFIEENNELLNFIEAGSMMFAELDQRKEDELKKFSEKTQERVKENKDNYLEHISRRNYKLLKQLTEILEQSRKFCLAVNESVDTDLDAWTFRDQCMKENISWITEYENEEKIFVWAHNAHIKKGGKPENPDSKALGYYLDQEYGKDYYAIGFDFGTGSFKHLDMESENPKWGGEESFDSIHEKTLAREFNGLEESFFFLDISSASKDEKLGEWINRDHRIHSAGTYFHLERVEDHYDSLNPPESFDALIFLSEITASQPIET